MLSVIKVQLKVMIFNFFKSHTHQDLINLMFCFQLESSHRWFKFHFNNPTYDLIFLSSIRIISINPSLPPHPLTLLIIIPLIKHNLNLSINGVTSLPCTLYPMRPFLSKPDLVFLLVVKLSRYYCISFRVGFLSTQFLINPKYWILWSHHLPFPIFSSASSPSPSRRAVSYGWCCLGSLWETHTNCSGEQASLAIEALETSITHLSLVKSRVLIFKATHQFEATGALKFLNTWSYQVIRIFNSCIHLSSPSLHQAQSQSDPTDLISLNLSSSQLGSEILTPFGRSQLFDMGVSYRQRYGFLLKKMSDRRPVFRTTTQDRMYHSALNFAAGFFGLPSDDAYFQQILIEHKGFNNSLASYDSCPNSDKPEIGDLGRKFSSQWASLYLSDATDRFNQQVTGLNFTSADLLVHPSAFFLFLLVFTPGSLSSWLSITIHHHLASTCNSCAVMRPSR